MLFSVFSIAALYSRLLVSPMHLNVRDLRLINWTPAVKHLLLLLSCVANYHLFFMRLIACWIRVIFNLFGLKTSRLILLVLAR